MPADKSPLIIGHRGASAVAPENTLAAFARALDDGADGLELDVRLAGDGVPVVIHDSTLKRTGMRHVTVARSSSQELGAIDVGTWFNREHPALSNDDYTRARVATLEQVLQFVVAREKANFQVVYIELKTNGGAYDNLVASVVKLISHYDLYRRAVIVSFHHSAIAKTKQLNPSMRTGALFAPRHGGGLGWRTQRIIAAANECGADEILLHRLIARPRLIEAAARNNLLVVMWTVDDPAWIPRAKQLGVHALITNDPALLLAYRDATS